MISIPSLNGEKKRKKNVHRASLFDTHRWFGVFPPRRFRCDICNETRKLRKTKPESADDKISGLYRYEIFEPFREAGRKTKNKKLSRKITNEFPCIVLAIVFSRGIVIRIADFHIIIIKKKKCLTPSCCSIDNNDKPC